MPSPSADELLAADLELSFLGWGTGGSPVQSFLAASPALGCTGSVTASFTASSLTGAEQRASPSQSLATEAGAGDDGTASSSEALDPVADPRELDGTPHEAKDPVRAPRHLDRTPHEDTDPVLDPRHLDRTPDAVPDSRAKVVAALDGPWEFDPDEVEFQDITTTSFGRRKVPTSGQPFPMIDAAELLACPFFHRSITAWSVARAAAARRTQLTRCDRCATQQGAAKSVDSLADWNRSSRGFRRFLFW